MTFAPAPEPDDVLADASGIDLYVAPEVAAVFDESIIDAREEDGRTSLVLRKQPGVPEAGDRRG